MRKNLTAAVMAGTLGIAFAAAPAYADKYGSWILTDTKLLSSQFIPDSDAPTDRYGTWVLIDASMDKQWLANTSRTQPIGNREVGRTMASDNLTYGASFTDRVKNYGAESTEYRNEYDKEELMGTENYQSVSGSYAYTIQNFRIDNHKDKYIHHPYTSTYHYDETLKHTYNFNLTNEVITRVFFKDAINNTETSADLVELVPSSVVTETDYAKTGKTLSYSNALSDAPPRYNSKAAIALAATGDDVTGPVHVVTTGAKQQRMIGDSVKRNDKLSSATTQDAQDKVLMSNTQVGVAAAAKVTSKGLEVYNAQGLNTVKVSEKTTTVDEKKAKVGKEFSDSVDKLVEKITDKANSKTMLQNIANVYATADTQDKLNLLKQSVMVAAAKASLSENTLTAIENILNGEQAGNEDQQSSKAIKGNDNSGTKGNVTQKAKATIKETTKKAVDEVSEVLSVKPPKATPKPSAPIKVTPIQTPKPSAPIKVAPVPAPKLTPTPAPKVDPLVYLLQNLGGRNQNLAYYLNLARSGGDPLAYIKKAKTYAKTKDDLSAINAVLDEQINRAQDQKNSVLKKALELLKKL